MEKQLEGNFAFTLQRYHISALEICAAIAVNEPTPKHVGVWVNCNQGLEAIDLHRVIFGF